MTELDELYQQVILDHNKNPRNFGKMDDPTNHAHGHNPLCGDQIELAFKVNDGIIEDVRFEGSGCAISQASASIMTTLVKGKKVDEVKQLFERFHKIVTADPGAELDYEDLGKLAVFGGVREFPARIKCASLSWHTMIEALEKQSGKVSTE